MRWYYLRGISCRGLLLRYRNFYNLTGCDSSFLLGKLRKTIFFLELRSKKKSFITVLYWWVAGGKAYQQLLQKRQQCVQQMPPRPRIYPSQQVPPLPFPYPKYMKPIVVYIKEEPVSPILEVEADLPPDYIEEDDGWIAYYLFAI